MPDLASIAAATEPGILALEEEAKSLEISSAPDAVALLKKWSQSLRKKPRPEQSLASFRAQFLRSNALERALEALRKNIVLRQTLLDRPLFAPPGKKDISDELMGEFQKLVRICFSRAAAPLAELTLKAVLSQIPQDAAAALAALRLLKEDWMEVVQLQIMRGLEYRLDSLDYEQQKRVGVHKGAAMHAGRHPSRERVKLLAQLCKAIADSHVRAQARSKSLSASLAGDGLPLQDEHQRGKSHADAPGQGTLCRRSSSRPCASDALPSATDCEAAVLAILSRTPEGVVNGLRLLGLPEAPLVFIPGEELRLCGMDIRKAMNVMLAHWVQEEQDDFYGSLQRIRGSMPSSVVGSLRVVPPTGVGQRPPPSFPHAPVSLRRSRTSESADGATTWPSDLRTERNEILRDRAALLKQVEALNDRLGEIDASLADCYSNVDTSSSSTPSSEAAPPGVRTSPASHTASAGQTLRGQSSLRGWLEPSASSGSLVATNGHGGSDFASMMSGIAESLVGEAHRGAERLAAQLQQRRMQLVVGLSAHLVDEEQHLMSSVACSSTSLGGNVAAMGAALAAQEALHAALREAQELCAIVAAVVGNHDLAGQAPEPALQPGARCQARWVDGRFYDACVQSDSGDGSVVVNWLRPRPRSMDGTPDQRPLVTVSESGGDDTLHRIVPKEDIRLNLSTSTCTESDELVAQQFFESRRCTDRSCADCGDASTDSASISFGIYLCRACAAMHEARGVRTSLVKQLGDGWGWTSRDLEYMRNGGNAAYHTCLKSFPAVEAMNAAARCETRFGEYYRRRLDALCAGAQVPPPPPPEAASAPSVGDFLGAAEAAAVVADATRRFEERVSRVCSGQGEAGGAFSTGDALVGRRQL